MNKLDVLQRLIDDGMDKFVAHILENGSIFAETYTVVDADSWVVCGINVVNDELYVRYSNNKGSKDKSKRYARMRRRLRRKK